MDGDKNLTEAEIQIERLRRLKEEKEIKEQKMKSDAMPFLQGKTTAIKRAPKQVRRRAPGMIKLDKGNYEKVHRITRHFADGSPGARIGRARLVNIILKEVLKDESVFTGIKNPAELKNLVSRIIQSERK